MPDDHGFTRRRLLAGGLAMGVGAVAASCGLFDDDGPERFGYGDANQQFSELWRPGGDPPWSAVVMIHGGSWSKGVDRSIMDPLARDLSGEGHAVWNIEYRTLGQRGGGWPGTLDDVGAAIDDVVARPDDVPIDPERVIVLGHSAGGHLALWAAARAALPAGAPGASPQVSPRAVVALAPVTDLAQCADDGIVEGTCAQLIGGSPAELPNRYAIASPQQRLPLGVPQRLFHGALDTVVPVAYSRAYVDAARAAGDDATVIEQADANHFTPIETDSAFYGQVRQVVNRLLQ